MNSSDETETKNNTRDWTDTAGSFAKDLGTILIQSMIFSLGGMAAGKLVSSVSGRRLPSNTIAEDNVYSFQDSKVVNG